MLLVVVSAKMMGFRPIRRIPIVVRRLAGRDPVASPIHPSGWRKRQPDGQIARHCRLICYGSRHLQSHHGNPLPKMQKHAQSFQKRRSKYRHLLLRQDNLAIGWIIFRVCAFGSVTSLLYLMFVKGARVGRAQHAAISRPISGALRP